MSQAILKLLDESTDDWNWIIDWAAHRIPQIINDPTTIAAAIVYLQRFIKIFQEQKRIDLPSSVLNAACLGCTVLADKYLNDTGHLTPKSVESRFAILGITKKLASEAELYALSTLLSGSSLLLTATEISHVQFAISQEAMHVSQKKSSSPPLRLVHSW